MCYNDEDHSAGYWDRVIASDVGLINDTLNAIITREQYEIMQYTGLKNKNGKEIYEGDIVQIKIREHIFIGVIQYKEQYAQFVITKTNTVAHEYEALGDYITDWLEVIGNIYENPKILEDRDAREMEH